MSYNISLAGSLYDPVDPINLYQGGKWVDELVPKTPLGSGGAVYRISSGELQHASEHAMRAYSTGYAYSREFTAQKFAASILCTYMILALFHTIYAVVTGWCSDCWDSAPELTALALSSEPQALNNTGAGIRTLRTFQKPMRVVARDDRLEISMARRRRRADENIREGHAYGW